MVTTKFDIPKFNGKNFAMWKVKIYAILVKDGCAVALKGIDQKPEAMTDIQFAEKDEIAKADIFLALEDKVLFNVQTVDTTAKELWESLHKIYEDKSLVNKIFLRRQLYNLRMKDGVTIHEHLNAFNTLVIELLGTGVKVDDEEQATLLLCSMPDSWDNLIMSLSHISKLDLDSVVASLLSEESRRKSLEQSTSSSGEHALVSEGSNGPRGKTNNGNTGSDNFKGRGDIRCFYCDKVGHIKRHCHKLKEQLKNKKKDKEEDKNQNNLVDCELVVMSSCVNKCSGSTHGSNWVVDSGASFHATPDRRFFTTYKSANFGVVRMGNHGKCKVVGIGDVGVVTNMGHTLVLKNVRHVPDLRLNLMSAGKLDDRGFASHFANGVWKLMKGSLVVARGSKCCSLYRTVLQGYKAGVAVIGGGSTKKVWRRRIIHTEVEVCDKKEASQGYFSGVHNHDEKRVSVEQDREGSLQVTGIHGLVKQFESKLALKEEAKVMMSRKLSRGVPPERVGEMS